MESLRKRVPFKSSETGQDSNEPILDEQEQDELIQKLREENAVSNDQYILILRIILAFSSVLQLTFLVTPSQGSPLLAIFPTASTDASPSIPLPGIFTISSLFIHLNLAILFHPDEVRLHLRLTNSPRPLSYQTLYALSAVPLTLSLFLAKPWQTTIWWCLTPVIVFIVQIVMESIQYGVQSIAELESMKYVAPGA